MKDYTIYKTQLDICLDKVSKKEKKSYIKEFGLDYKIFAGAFTDSYYESDCHKVFDHSNAQLYRVVSDEYQWVKNGSPVILIENKELLNNIYLSKFPTNELVVIPPFKTFSVSFPNDTYIKGIKIKNMLITIKTYKEFRMAGDEITNDSYYNEYCEPSPDDDKVFININSNITNDSSCGTYRLLSDIGLSENHEEDDLCDALTRIALSLCIYHSATEGQKLISGFSDKTILIPKDRNRTFYRGHMLQEVKSQSTTKNKINSEGRKIHLRRPFYRNLRAKRFYKGKYKNCPIGSRWVFVKGIDKNKQINTLLN
ncbi:hypothetical protein [Vibrio anguillarum]|nr:hypothetical protein [Vibrio anguillarum]MBF4230442.1 hypothetical protein [Vibrio anguillarum]